MKKISFVNEGCTGGQIPFYRNLAKCVEGDYEITLMTHEADVIIVYICGFILAADATKFLASMLS